MAKYRITLNTIIQKCTLLIEKILISNSYYKNKLTKKIENYERV